MIFQQLSHKTTDIKNKNKKRIMRNEVLVFGSKI